LNRLTKRSGELEEFSEAKLRASLTNAGASEENARKVCEIVARSAREGMQTAEIRRLAASELARWDSTAAQRYEEFTRR
jgi:2-phosphoglycerate kinase